MSLIIAYVGKKGCVMVSDKRKIGYFGDKNNLGKLEEELYSGQISTDDELNSRAEELGISIKITDDANKIKIIGNTVRGEVSSKGTLQTLRRRIYGTTNGYEILELDGSEVMKRDFGESGIVVFGNDFAKNMANEFLSKRWKNSSSLRSIGELFIDIGNEVASKTPSVGKDFDLLKQNPSFTKDDAIKHLDRTIDHDLKVLTKFRQQLYQQNVEITNQINIIASKIISEGEVGEVSSLDDNIVYVKLNNDVQAIDYKNYKQLAGPGEIVIMTTTSDDIEVGDKVIIEDELLCLKKNKLPLNCEIMLCSL